MLDQVRLPIQGKGTLRRRGATTFLAARGGNSLVFKATVVVLAALLALAI